MHKLSATAFHINLHDILNFLHKTCQILPVFSSYSILKHNMKVDCPPALYRPVMVLFHVTFDYDVTRTLLAVVTSLRTGVVLVEALVSGDNAMQQARLGGQCHRSRHEPAVTCEMKQSKGKVI